MIMKVSMPQVPDIKANALFRINGKEASLSFILNSGMLGLTLEDLSMAKNKPKDKKKKKKNWYHRYHGFTKRKCREIANCTIYTTALPEAFFSVWNWVCFQIFALYIYIVLRYNIFTNNGICGKLHIAGFE